MFQNNLYLHALNSLEGFGPKAHRSLSKDPREAWEDRDKWKKLFGEQTASKWISQAKSINLNEEADLIDEHQISLIGLQDEEYPAWLRELHLPPFLLYLRGGLPQPQQPLLTIVGSRKHSRYGQAILEHWIPELVRAGIGIISGLAIGIDGLAHAYTLKAQGYTAAILGSGVCQITPRQHDQLAKQLLQQGGGVLSEYPPFQEPLKGFFPRRNRLLAGISPMTLVIEAAEKSGALITARYALDANRDVGALPGPTTSETSQGCNNLLKQGAHVITSAQDLLDLYGLDPATKPKESPSFTPDEQALLRHLQTTPIPLDLLLQKTGLSLSSLLQTLSRLELKGVAGNDPAQGYFLKQYVK